MYKNKTIVPIKSGLPFEEDHMAHKPRRTRTEQQQNLPDVPKYPTSAQSLALKEWCHLSLEVRVA